MNSSIQPPSTSAGQTQVLLNRYQWVRGQSEALISPLSIEDCNLQAAAFVSPAKWHLAHTTWFFETFILLQHRHDYQVYDEHFQYLFNSYYNGIGEQFSRPNRHLLSRPTLDQIQHYRADIDDQMCSLITEGISNEVAQLIELGLNHEQQHQELLLMDIKYCLFQNPLYPAYDAELKTDSIAPLRPLEMLEYDEQVVSIGREGTFDFCFDNETPKHKTLLTPFALANRLVSNAEYLQFISDGGYDNPLLWLSDGWSWRQQQKCSAPYYWLKRDGRWFEYTLAGLQPLNPNQPLCHINYYEAQAFATWSGKRLPTEFEWEWVANKEIEMPKNERLHPHYSVDNDFFHQVWQWTQSAYQAYPGYKPAAGAVGEYNGKFMTNQYVLKGGCALTPEGHVRTTYRNFFYPQDFWPMTGIRLAEDR
ncbi:ergothioneine biosynthesis protein EgtB [Bermanella marisrubri]|uniref:Ergothioneine biosynthesis protein EgtB n=1 Tax=Bermanella marisrubri TaxID=207949 RepID=Q1MZ77_9GAMM|nr:ergothioneine biosynthesis protein EgtB [Bermanella marisrubri]EAT11256.1 hypothetical protein RED65_08369 [Oceanobacter sp. RED65] [Bermanella marisrubri]QIZ82739.1 ergothioneine biosynthesis protein EgtB [Bermanella marisrubri]